MSALWTLEPRCHMVTLLLGCFSGLVPFPAKHHATLSLTGTKTERASTLGYVSRSCLDTDLNSSQIFSVRLDLFTQQGTVSFHTLISFLKYPVYGWCDGLVGECRSSLVAWVWFLDQRLEGENQLSEVILWLPLAYFPSTQRHAQRDRPTHTQIVHMLITKI